MGITEDALMRDRVIQLALLIAALVVAAVLLWWVAANVARQYRRARRTLEEDRLALLDTQERLDRVSALERGQAQVLERIATAVPVSVVLRQILALAAEVSGGRAVRIDAGARSLVHPPGADVSGTPAWSGPFHTDTDHMGALEVFAEPDALDDLAHTALMRCRDLVTLALERDASAATCRTRPVTTRSPAWPTAACC